MDKTTAVAADPIAGNGTKRVGHKLGDIDLRTPSLYINRELSNIEFNRRVLGECSADHPLLERVTYFSMDIPVGFPS